VGESILAEKIEEWEKSLPAHIKLAYLPSLNEVKLRLTSIGNSKSLLENETEDLVAKLRERIGQFIYGYGEDPLEVVIGNTLKAKKLTLAVAESCTGGYLSHLITTVPGSSEYFLGSLIPYSYEIKMQQLGVNLRRWKNMER
jgi:nicotinamide-nucleotide amidase